MATGVVAVYVLRSADAALLARYAAVAGNFEHVAAECLRAGATEEMDAGGRATVACDGHAFNYLASGDYVIVAVTAEGFAREVAFGCARRCAAEWAQDCGDRGDAAAPGALDAEFGPVLKREVEYANTHKTELARAASLQQAVDAVKGAAAQNAEQAARPPPGPMDGVAVAGAPAGPEAMAEVFRKKGAELRLRMWRHNFKAKACLVALVLCLLAAIIGMGACFAGASRCFGGNDLSAAWSRAPAGDDDGARATGVSGGARAGAGAVPSGGLGGLGGAGPGAGGASGGTGDGSASSGSGGSGSGGGSSGSSGGSGGGSGSSSSGDTSGGGSGGGSSSSSSLGGGGDIRIYGSAPAPGPPPGLATADGLLAAPPAPSPP